MNSKLISPELWRTFCSDSVILGEFGEYVLTDHLHMKILLRHHAVTPVTEPLKYSVRRGKITLAEGEIPVNIHGQGLFRLGEIDLDLKPASHVHKINVKLKLPHTENVYSIWQFPAIPMPEPESSEELCITSNKTEMLFMLKHGRNVLYLPNYLRHKLPDNSGTLGLHIDKHHQALGKFRCERWSTPQWYAITAHADYAVLDGLKLHPIVQVIDDFNRNHKLGILFECRVGEGNLLVCTSRLWEIASRPEVHQFARSIIDYASSEAFYPKEALTFKQIEEL